MYSSTEHLLFTTHSPEVCDRLGAIDGAAETRLESVVQPTFRRPRMAFSPPAMTLVDMTTSIVRATLSKPPLVRYVHCEQTPESTIAAPKETEQARQFLLALREELDASYSAETADPRQAAHIRALRQMVRDLEIRFPNAARSLNMMPRELDVELMHSATAQNITWRGRV